MHTFPITNSQVAVYVRCIKTHDQECFEICHWLDFVFQYLTKTLSMKENYVNTFDKCTLQIRTIRLPKTREDK